MNYQVAVCDKCGEKYPCTTAYQGRLREREHALSCDGTFKVKNIPLRSEKDKLVNPAFIGKLLTILDDNDNSVVPKSWGYDGASSHIRADLTHIGFEYLTQQPSGVKRIERNAVIASLEAHCASVAGMNKISLNYTTRSGFAEGIHKSWKFFGVMLAPLKGNTFALAYRFANKTYMTAMPSGTNHAERIKYLDSPAFIAVNHMGLPVEAAGLLSAFYIHNGSDCSGDTLKSSFELLEPSAEEGEVIPRLTNGVITLLAPSIQTKEQRTVERFALMEITEEDRDVILAQDKKNPVWKKVRARAKGLLA